MQAYKLRAVPPWGGNEYEVSIAVNKQRFTEQTENLTLQLEDIQLRYSGTLKRMGTQQLRELAQKPDLAHPPKGYTDHARMLRPTALLYTDAGIAVSAGKQGKRHGTYLHEEQARDPCAQPNSSAPKLTRLHHMRLTRLLAPTTPALAAWGVPTLRIPCVEVTLPAATPAVAEAQVQIMMSAAADALGGCTVRPNISAAAVHRGACTVSLTFGPGTEHSAMAIALLFVVRKHECSLARWPDGQTARAAAAVPAFLPAGPQTISLRASASKAPQTIALGAQPSASDTFASLLGELVAMASVKPSPQTLQGGAAAAGTTAADDAGTQTPPIHLLLPLLDFCNPRTQHGKDTFATGAHYSLSFTTPSTVAAELLAQMQDVRITGPDVEIILTCNREAKAQLAAVQDRTVAVHGLTSGDLVEGAQCMRLLNTVTGQAQSTMNSLASTSRITPPMLQLFNFKTKENQPVSGITAENSKDFIATKEGKSMLTAISDEQPNYSEQKITCFVAFNSTGAAISTLRAFAQSTAPRNAPGKLQGIAVGRTILNASPYRQASYVHAHTEKRTSGANAKPKGASNSKPGPGAKGSRDGKIGLLGPSPAIPAARLQDISELQMQEVWDLTAAAVAGGRCTNQVIKQCRERMHLMPAQKQQLATEIDQAIVQLLCGSTTSEPSEGASPHLHNLVEEARKLSASRTRPLGNNASGGQPHPHDRAAAGRSPLEHTNRTNQAQSGRAGNGDNRAQQQHKGKQEDGSTDQVCTDTAVHRPQGKHDVKRNVTGSDADNASAGRVDHHLSADDTPFVSAAKNCNCHHCHHQLNNTLHATCAPACTCDHPARTTGATQAARQRWTQGPHCIRAGAPDSVTCLHTHLQGAEEAGCSAAARGSCAWRHHVGVTMVPGSWQTISLNVCISNTVLLRMTIALAMFLAALPIIMRSARIATGRNPAQIRCRGGKPTYAAAAATGLPEQPYFEKQDRQFCMIHALNACIGKLYIRATSVLQHAVRLDANLKNKSGGKKWLENNYFRNPTGKFSVPVVNHYLKVYGAGKHLAYHSNASSYEPTNRHLTNAGLNLAENYERGIMPGSSKEQVLSRLPDSCTAIMLHYDKPYRGPHRITMYGHASCLKLHEGAWWWVDSEDQQPKALEGEGDWARLYGKIYTLREGDAPQTARDIEEAWQGLETDDRHAITNNADHVWQTAAQRHTRQPQAVQRTQAASGTDRHVVHQTTAPAARPCAAPRAPPPPPPPAPRQAGVVRGARQARPQKRPAGPNPADKRIQATMDKFLAKISRKDPGEGTDASAAAAQTSQTPAQQDECQGAHAQQMGAPCDGTANRQPENSRGSTLKLLHHTFSTGLYRGQEDLNMLISKHDPDVLTLSETGATTKQLKSRWLRRTLSGYKIFGSPAPTGEQVNAVLAVKEHIANLGEVSRVPEITAENSLGRLVSVRLLLPRTNPLTLSALYAPAGNKPEEQQLRGEMYKTLGQLMHGPHIIAGDMNAALMEGDRSNADPAQGTANKDAAHKAFVTEHQPASPDAHCIPRPHSFHSNGDLTVTSRIDDVLINRAVAPGAADLQVMEEGTCSDKYGRPDSRCPKDPCLWPKPSADGIDCTPAPVQVQHCPCQPAMTPH